MHSDFPLDLHCSVISDIVSITQSPLQGQLCSEPLQSQSIRTPFMEADIVFMKLLNLGIVDELGIVQKGKFHIQEFFKQKLDIEKLEDLPLRQFLQIIFDEIKLLPNGKSEETGNVYLSGKNAWELLKRSGILDDVMQSLEFLEAHSVLQNNLTESYDLEIFVCVKDVEHLVLLRNAVCYEVKHREDALDTSKNPFEFSYTSFEKCPQTLSFQLKTVNGSSITLKIISLDQLNKETAVKISLNSNADEYPVQFNSRNLWQILINRLIGVPTINFKHPMEFILDLTEGRRTLDSNLVSVKVSCEVCTTNSPQDINRLYAIAFQICVLSQPSKDDCKDIWKAMEQLSGTLQKQDNVNEIFVLMKVLILDHNLPFNYILALFMVAGYIHQYTDQTNLTSKKPVAFALTGDEKGVLLQVQFNAKEPCYGILKLDLVWALHEIEQGQRHLLESAKNSLEAFYELLLPAHPVQQSTDYPSLQWISNGSIDLDAKTLKMLDEDQSWAINHLGILLRCIANIQRNEISYFCRMLEYLPKLLSKQVTEISRKFLLKSLNQLLPKLSLAVELREESLVINGINEQSFLYQYFFKWIVDCFSPCNDENIYQAFKKMWIQETSRGNTLNKEMENLGVQIVQSLISVNLTLEAILLYLHLCRKGKLESQTSLNLLSTLCASVRTISTTVNTKVHCIKLGEGIKLLLESLKLNGDKAQMPKSVSWVISELIGIESPLANDILNYAKGNKNVAVDDKEALKVKLLPSNCKTSMSEETTEEFLAIHQETLIKDGELWLRTLNFVEKLKEGTRKALINAWVKAELSDFIIYSSTQTRKECWMIVLNSLKDILEIDVAKLYKKFGEIAEAFEEEESQIQQLVKKTISILYKQLPQMPEQGILYRLLEERDSFSGDKEYFNGIEKPFIILLCHSDSYILQLKGLNFFMNWVKDKNHSDSHQAFSNMLLELFRGIMQTKGYEESLHKKLLEIITLLRTTVGSTLAHLICAEKCLTLSPLLSSEIHHEATALALEGLKRHQLSAKLDKYNKNNNNDSSAKFNFNKVINDKPLHSTLNLLLDKMPLIVDPSRMFELLDHVKIPDLINAKSLCLLWSKYFTQLKLIFESDCTVEKKVKWNEFILKNLPRIEIEPNLVQEHFECYMDRMFSKLSLEDGAEQFTKMWSATSKTCIADIDECNDPDSNNRRLSIYLPLYGKLFIRCLKALNSAIDSKHIECLYDACEEMMSKVEKYSSPSLFKSVEIPYQKFLSWRPKEGSLAIFQEHISTTFFICRTALKDRFFQKKQDLASKVIPAIFEHLFNFISLYPYMTESVHDWYDEAKEIMSFLLKNKVISKQHLESIMNKLILLAPLPYGIYDKNTPIKVRNVNWISENLSAFAKKQFFTTSDIRVFAFHLSAELPTEKIPLKYDNIKDVFIGLFDKCSKYPNYSLVIRCTYLLSRFLTSLQPKDFAICLDKLQRAIMHLPSNLKTVDLLADLFGVTEVLISKYPPEINYKHPHGLVSSLIELQLNALNDLSDPSVDPKSIVEKALKFLVEVCKCGIYLNRWDDLYAIFLFMRNIVNKQEKKEFHLFLVGHMAQCSSGYLTNPQEQLQRAEFFVLCLEDISSIYPSFPKAVRLAINVHLKETMIFVDHPNLLDKYSKDKKSESL